MHARARTYTNTRKYIYMYVCIFYNRIFYNVKWVPLAAKSLHVTGSLLITSIRVDDVLVDEDDDDGNSI